MRTSTLLPLFLAVLAILISVEAQAITVYDSFTPPSTIGGSSSADSGSSIQLSVTNDIEIAGISVLTQMLFDGDLRFLILGGPAWDVLLITSALSFPEEESESWKRSPDFSFTLLGGNEYLAGYVRSVGVIDIGDHIAETQNGITSDLFIGCINGFANPSYSHHCISGVDFGVRLHAVPEPSTGLLMGLGLTMLTASSRRSGH